MAVWVVRGGLFEEESLENDLISIGFGIEDDLSSALTREDVRRRIQQANRNATPNQIANHTGQVWAFKGRVQAGDLFVMPKKGKPTISIGEIAGEYKHIPDRLEQTHGRDVKWISKEVGRNSLAQDLKKSLSGEATVFQPRASNAEARLRAIANGERPDGELVEGPTSDGEDIDPPENLGEEANDRIRDYIGNYFHGHEFTRLVAAVLRAQGYALDVSPPGPDGGVDIVAGSGTMGFDQPRICVQVKSGLQTTKVNVLRELEGIIKNFGADYGLLVSWGGFTGDTEREARKNTYFNVRLWNSDDFLNALFENYDRLPAGLKAELPLKQVWILDEPTL